MYLFEGLLSLLCPFQTCFYSVVNVSFTSVVLVYSFSNLLYLEYNFNYIISSSVVRDVRIRILSRTSP